MVGKCLVGDKRKKHRSVKPWQRTKNKNKNRPEMHVELPAGQLNLSNNDILRFVVTQRHIGLNVGNRSRVKPHGTSNCNE